MAFKGLEPTSDCLVPLLDAIEAQTKGALTGMSDAAMTWRPPSGGWGVGQVLEHMIASNKLYNETIGPIIEQAEPAADQHRPWKPSLMGGLLIRAVLPTNARKLPTAGKLEPGPEPGPDVVARFLGTVRETRDLVRAAQGLDMRRHRFTSPVNPIVRRLNLGDGLVVLVAHTQRHLQQIQRVMGHPDFPREPRPA